MSLLAHLQAAASEPWYAIVDRAIYRFERVCSDDLRRVGYAHLEGSIAAAIAQEEAAQPLREQIATAGLATEADRAARLEALRQRDEERRARRTREALQSEAGAAAALERATAYVCAAVTGGCLLPGDAPAEPHGSVRVTRELPAGAEVEAFRFVPRREGAAGASVWVHTLSAGRRLALGNAIVAALDVAPEVLPFRGGPVDAPAPGEDLGVRGAAPARGDRVAELGGGAG